MMPKQKSNFVHTDGLSGFPEDILTKYENLTYDKDTQKYKVTAADGTTTESSTELIIGGAILEFSLIAVPLGLLFWGAKKIAD